MSSYRFRLNAYGQLKEYNIRLRYPELPLVDVGGTKANLLPPEVCEILPNQPFRGKLSDECTSVMITAAAKWPNINAQTIMSAGLKELGFRTGAPALTSFGINIGTEMTVLPGRILPTPSLSYGAGSGPVEIDKASWNLKRLKFLRCSRLTNWVVFCVVDNGRDEFNGPNDPELKRTVDTFAQTCRSSGMAVDPHSAVLYAKLTPKEQDDSVRSKAIDDIRTGIKAGGKKPSFVLVILSNGDKHIYSGIKYLCDSWLDIPTVCAHAGKIRQGTYAPAKQCGFIG